MRLRRLLNEAQELDAEEERRLYPWLTSACCQRMKSGSMSAFRPSLVVFSHSAKARSSRYMKLRTSAVLQNSSYSSRISSCVIDFAFFNAPWFLNAIGTGLFHRWHIWRCAHIHAMVRIAISEAACDSLAETLPFGSVGYENAVDDKGNRLIWVPPDALAKLKACAAPVASQTIGVIGRRCHRPATARAPPVGFDTRLGLSPRDRSGHRDYERRASRFHGGVVQPQRPPPSPPRGLMFTICCREERLS